MLELKMHPHPLNWLEFKMMPYQTAPFLEMTLTGIFLNNSAKTPMT